MTLNHKIWIGKADPLIMDHCNLIQMTTNAMIMGLQLSLLVPAITFSSQLFSKELKQRHSFAAAATIYEVLTERLDSKYANGHFIFGQTEPSIIN